MSLISEYIRGKVSPGQSFCFVLRENLILRKTNSELIFYLKTFHKLEAESYLPWQK